MSWNLTDEEQGQVMDAVAKAIAPWTGRVESSILFEGEPMTIHPVGIREDAPEEIRELGAIYESVISKGAIAVDPEYIQMKSERNV